MYKEQGVGDGGGGQVIHCLSFFLCKKSLKIQEEDVKDRLCENVVRFGCIAPGRSCLVCSLCRFFSHTNNHPPLATQCQFTKELVIGPNPTLILFSSSNIKFILISQCWVLALSSLWRDPQNWRG